MGAEVDVRVVASDRTTHWVRAKAVSVAGKSEVIISDRLCGELGIEPVRMWRLS